MPQAHTDDLAATASVLNVKTCYVNRNLLEKSLPTDNGQVHADIKYATAAFRIA